MLYKPHKSITYSSKRGFYEGGVRDLFSENYRAYMDYQVYL